MKKDTSKYFKFVNHSGQTLASCYAKDEKEAKHLLSFFIANYPKHRLILAEGIKFDEVSSVEVAKKKISKKTKKQ